MTYFDSITKNGLDYILVPKGMKEPVVISQEHYDYLKRMEKVALRSGQGKAEIYNEQGKCIALQG